MNHVFCWFGLLMRNNQTRATISFQKWCQRSRNSSASGHNSTSATDNTYSLYALPAQGHRPLHNIYNPTIFEKPALMPENCLCLCSAEPSNSAKGRKVYYKQKTSKIQVGDHNLVLQICANNRKNPKLFPVAFKESPLVKTLRNHGQTVTCNLWDQSSLQDQQGQEITFKWIYSNRINKY